MGGDPSPSPLDLANQACVGVDPSALTLINAFSISQEEHIFPCDTEKSYFFQCPKAAPYQSSNRKADQRKKKKKKKKFLTYSQSSMSLRDGGWEVDIDRNTTTFQTKGKIFTSVNTLHILQALAKSALKILHLHLLLTSNIHKGYANTKPFQELMFPLESISFI